ncbi:MAG: hypothetical protein JXN60_02225 [Lentisphaerae bacterium]|nr:hypothetical protein [Lentisphaerota bacterium]
MIGKHKLLICVVSLFGMSAFATTLIVTKDGAGIVATEAGKVGDKIIYIDRQTGNEEAIDINKVDGVVPSVERGKQYEPDRIQKYIDRIKKLQKKHYRLTRQLNEQLQQWEALQRPSPELESAIVETVELFAAGNRGTDEYKKACLALEMLKYKDLRGDYTQKIDRFIETMKSEYLSVNMKRLEVMTGDAQTDINVFVKARTLGEEMLRIAAHDNEKMKIDRLLAAARKRTFDTNAQLARTSFAREKSIDSYLGSARILHLLKQEVAGTDVARREIDKSMAAIIGQISVIEPTYDFTYEGFPISPGDTTLLRMTRQYASVVTFATVPVETECFMFPIQKPKHIRFGLAFRMPVRLLFRMAQPADREYAMVVMLREQTGMHTHTIMINAFQIKRGRSDITVNEDFSDLDSGFVPVRELEGGVYYFIYLACRVKAEGSDIGDQWQAISATCAWPTVYR